MASSRSIAFLGGVAAAAGWAIDMKVPPAGSDAPITGTVTDVAAGAKFSDYKLAILTSADNGATYWDKSHSPYFLAWTRGEMANPGELQNAAVVIQSDWSFTLKGYAASPYDATSNLWRAYLVPASFNMKWPDYQIEGIPMPDFLPAAALCFEDVTKSGGRVAGGPMNGGGAAPPPAASPAAPAASPAAPAASKAPAASPAAPPAASPAAPPATSPAASPAAPPASGSTAPLPAVTNNATTGDANQLPVTSGAESMTLHASVAAALVAVGLAAAGAVLGA